MDAQDLVCVSAVRQWLCRMASVMPDRYQATRLDEACSMVAAWDADDTKANLFFTVVLVGNGYFPLKGVREAVNMSILWEPQ
eukprot:3938093-Rhodomonas_salina.1